MSSIFKELEDNEHECLVFADELVVFSNNLYLNLIIAFRISTQVVVHVFFLLLKYKKPTFLLQDVIINVQRLQYRELQYQLFQHNLSRAYFKFYVSLDSSFLQSYQVYFLIA